MSIFNKEIKPISELEKPENYNVGFLYGLHDKAVGWIGFNILQNDRMAQRHFKTVVSSLDDDFKNDLSIYKICPISQIAEVEDITPFEEGEFDNVSE